MFFFFFFKMFLQIVSNGEYRSVQHRVLANSNNDPRISIVMFFNLAKWKGSGYYGPLPELLTPQNPAIYRDFTMQEFNQNFYSKGLDSKSLIDKIKLWINGNLFICDPKHACLYDLQTLLKKINKLAFGTLLGEYNFTYLIIRRRINKLYCLLIICFNYYIHF